MSTESYICKKEKDGRPSVRIKAEKLVRFE